MNTSLESAVNDLAEAMNLPAIEALTECKRRFLATLYPPASG
jgi:hypothetical protein